MEKSIVKAPRDITKDYDFIAFSFDGKHSYEDFGIIRTSGGDRFEEKMAPTMNDKTAEVPGMDGKYYFGTEYKQRDFNITFAFDGLTEGKLGELKRWLCGDKVADLWFAEAPYKVYSVKVSGQPALKYIPFDSVKYVDLPPAADELEDIVYKQAIHSTIYKGEGSVTFTAYYPFAHTPDEVHMWDSTSQKYINQGRGTEPMSYSSFANFQNYKHLINEYSHIKKKTTEIIFCGMEDVGNVDYR